MAEYFGDVLSRAISRRGVLKSAIFGAGLTLLAYGVGGGVSASPQPLTFRTIYPNNKDEITIPEGFNYNIVMR